MKRQHRYPAPRHEVSKVPLCISQLTLELYSRGLATFSERRQVEKALKTDSETRKRYEALQESDKAIRQLVRQELDRQNVPQTPTIQFPQKKKVVVGLIVAAALLLCAIIPTILYLKSGNSNNPNTITEETTEEIITPNETYFIEETPNTEIALPNEPPKQRGGSDNKPVIAETPRIEPNSGITIAEAPATDTGIKLRGENTATVPEPTPNINIPPGITFIFENMFADKGLTFAIIPTRITSIGKNAFSGNPLLSVTIGANVSIEETAFPGSFAAAYNANGKTAGTYTRPDINSEAWVKK